MVVRLEELTSKVRGEEGDLELLVSAGFAVVGGIGSLSPAWHCVSLWREHSRGECVTCGMLWVRG